MITEKEYQILYKKWLTVGEAYAEYRRVGYRLKHFCEHCLPYLKGKKVVEVGCNAGAFGREIAEVAEEYHGVEPANKVRDPKKKSPPKTDFFKQLEITKNHIKKPNFNIYNDTIAEFCNRKIEINAFVACFAMYHFRDYEISLLTKYIFPQCDVVIIQNRIQKRPTKHNSFKFWKNKNVVKFFEMQNFKVDVIYGERDGKKTFAENICTRLKQT